MTEEKDFIVAIREGTGPEKERGVVGGGVR